MKRFKDLNENQEFKFASKSHANDHILRKILVWTDNGVCLQAYQYVDEVPYPAKIIAYTNMGDRDVLTKVTKVVETWE